jgi:multidrug efflux system membrane fusion protein
MRPHRSPFANTFIAQTMKPLVLVLVPTLSLLLVACSKPEPAAQPVRTVKLMTVGATTVGGAQEYAGEVKARVESRLGFRVGGKLVQRPAEVGQRVQAGQLLAQLDATDLALGNQAAQAQVSAAQTQRDLAAADLKRFAELKAQGFISGAELERRQATLDAAEATLRQARAQGAVQGNQAAYARLLADAAGVVVGVDAEVGQVVAAGAPVVRLARDGARDVVFAVPEDRLATVRPGGAAQVRLWAAAQGGPAAAPLSGTVREVAASADPLTRTYQVKLALPADAGIPLGATAYVALAGSAAGTSAMALPTSAIMRSPDGGQGSSVWVFDPATSTVKPRTVQLSGADGNHMLVVSGLKPGEEVVAAGVHVLTAGQKVVRFGAAAPASN